MVWHCLGLMSYLRCFVTFRLVILLPGISCENKLFYSVKLHLRHKRRHWKTDKETSVCPLCPSYTGGRSEMLHRNLRRGGGVKNPGSTNKYTKFVQLIIKKIFKIIATRCHIWRLKCTKFDSWRLSVCLVWPMTHTVIQAFFFAYLASTFHVQRRFDVVALLSANSRMRCRRIVH